jgi:enoyl-CoA hydratase
MDHGKKEIDYYVPESLLGVEDVIIDFPAPRVMRITMNRPQKRNALSFRLRAQLLHHLQEADDDTDIHVVIIRGAGKDFCGGYEVDISGQKILQPVKSTPRREGQFVRSNIEMFSQIWDMGVATIAEVQGHCLAGGTEVAAACDIVVVAEDAKIGYPPVRTMGTPDLQVWPYLVGHRQAMKLMLTGDTMSGTEAARLGWATEAVPAWNLEATVLSLASRIAKTEPQILTYSKRGVHMCAEQKGIRNALRWGGDLQQLSMTTDVSKAVLGKMARGSLTNSSQKTAELFRERDAAYTTVQATAKPAAQARSPPVSAQVTSPPVSAASRPVSPALSSFNMAHMSDYVLKDPVTEEDIGQCGGYTEEFFTKLHMKFGNFAEFYVNGERTLSLLDKDAILEVHDELLIRPDLLFPVLNYLGKENLLFRKDHAQIHQIRDQYESVIHSQGIYKAMQDITTEALEKAIVEWSNGPAINLHQELGWVIYDIMGKIMFGGEWSSQTIGREIKRLHQYLIENSERWAYLPEEQKAKEPDYKKYIGTIQQLRDICGNMLDEKRKQGEQPTTVNAFSLLLTAKGADGKDFFDREFAISTMVGFLNGAYDTTHSTLHWALFHLAKFPAVQETLRQEILKSVGENGPFTMAQCNKVAYLENVVKESQRCKATTPFNMRSNPDRDVTIKGVHIPKGTTVITPYFLAYQNTAAFGSGADDPNCFDPTRWEGEDDAAKKAIGGPHPIWRRRTNLRRLSDCKNRNKDGDCGNPPPHSDQPRRRCAVAHEDAHGGGGATARQEVLR